MNSIFLSKAANTFACIFVLVPIISFCYFAIIISLFTLDLSFNNSFRFPWRIKQNGKWNYIAYRFAQS